MVLGQLKPKDAFSCTRCFISHSQPASQAKLPPQPPSPSPLRMFEPLRHSLRCQKRLRHLRGVSLRNVTTAPLPASTLAEARTGLERLFLGLTHDPESLQTSLAEINHRRLEVATFYSLHAAPSREPASNPPPPLYISEVAYGEIDPEFQSVDFSACYASAMKDTVVGLKVWAGTDTWSNVINVLIDLNDLIRVSPESLSGPELPQPNTIILHFSDGLYLLPSSSYADTPETVIPKAYALTRESCSFDAIIKMKTFQQSLREMYSSKSVYIAQIEARLDETAANRAAEAIEQRKTLLRQLIQEEKMRVFTLEEANQKNRQRLEGCRTKCAFRATAALQEARQRLAQDREEFGTLLETHRHVSEAVQGERAARAASLARVFPIKADAEGCHRLFGMHIPPAFVQTVLVQFSSPHSLPSPSITPAPSHKVPIGEVDAVLAYLVQMLLEIEALTFIPLRYPVHYVGSKSLISDPLAPTGHTFFPLWIKDASGGGVAWLKFHRGLFLLHANLKQVLCSLLLLLTHTELTDFLGCMRAICKVLAQDPSNGVTERLGLAPSTLAATHLTTAKGISSPSIALTTLLIPSCDSWAINLKKAYRVDQGVEFPL